MKKPISILLLIVFFFFQGGRMLLYLECRFSNSITTSSCDCAQILTATTPGAISDVIPINTHANHKHLPEEFEVSAANVPHAAFTGNIKTHATFTSLISSGFTSGIFHPPLS